MSRSESPYDRFGQLTEDATRQRVYTLRLGQNPLQAAHEATGEWRDWRTILEASDVADPFDLMDVAHASAALVLDVPTTDGGAEQENFSEDLGQPLLLLAASPELDGTGQIEVTDVDEDTFTLKFKAPGADAFGEAVTLELERFTGIDGEQNLAVGVELLDASGRYVVLMELTLDTWLIVWLARCMDVLFVPSPSRSELVVPEVQL